MLSMLIQARDEDGRGMSDQELRDELMTLLVAGHETTATALAWAIERLVRHPESMERLRAEIDAGEDAYLDAVVEGDAAPPAGAHDRAPAPEGGHGDRWPHAARRRDGGAVHLPGAPARRTSIRIRTPSGPSAGSTSPRAPTPGSPSEAAPAAAWARASRMFEMKAVLSAVLSPRGPPHRGPEPGAAGAPRRDARARERGRGDQRAAPRRAPPGATRGRGRVRRPRAS